MNQTNEPQYGYPPGAPAMGQAHSVGAPPQGAGPVGGAGRAKLVKMAVGGVAAVAVLGGIGYAAFSLMGGRPGLDLAQLPETTKALFYGEKSSLSLGMFSDAFLKATESMCGDAGDFAPALFQGRGGGDFDADAAKEALACKQKWTKALRLGPQQVTFKKGDDEYTVAIYSKAPDEFPEVKGHKHPKKDPEGFKDATCFNSAEVEKKDKEDKDSKDVDPCVGKELVARLEEGKAVAVGKFDDLEAFGKTFSAEGKNKLDNMDDVQALVKNLLPMAGRVLIGKGLEKVVGDLPDVGKDDAELKKDLTKLLTGANAVAVSFELDGPVMRSRYEFIMASEKEAEELKTPLEKYLRAAKKQLKEEVESQKESLDKAKQALSDSKASKELLKYLKADNEWDRAASRSLMTQFEDDVEVKVSGKKASFDLKTSPDGDAKDAYKAMAAERENRMDLIEDIVSAIADGKEPPKDKVKELGQEAIDFIDPPDFVEHEGAKITVSGGKCRAGYGEGRFNCSVKETDEKAAMEKLTTKLKEDGFEVEDGFMGKTFKKGKAEARVSTSSRGGRVEFSIGIDKARD